MTDHFNRVKHFIIFYPAWVSVGVRPAKPDAVTDREKWRNCLCQRIVTCNFEDFVYS